MVLSLTSLEYCRQCNGTGIINDPGGRISCHTCDGNGVWLRTEGNGRLLLDLEPLVNPEEPGKLIRTQRIRQLSTGVGVALTAGSFLYITLQNTGGLFGLIWGPGIAHALFGASGLASMWGLAEWKAQDTTTHTLDQLMDTAESGGAIDACQFTTQSIQSLLSEAATVSEQFHNSEIDETVLLLTLLTQPRIQGILRRMEKDPEELITLVTALVVSQGAGHTSTFTVHPTARARLYNGLLQAINNIFPYYDLEDLLLAYAKSPSIFTDAFNAFGLSYENAYAISRWYAQDEAQASKFAFWLERGRTRPKGFMNRAWTALPTPFLDGFSQDLTKLAGSGYLAAVTVREAEISQILQILGRTQKNSVLLVGEPGVGKETIVGAVALRMLEEQVPEVLKDKRLVMLDTTTLLGSADSATQNTQQILHEVAQAGNVILALPNVQALVGQNGTAVDAASQLANALNKGIVQVISTATYADYHRYVETNPQLTNLLDVIEIKEITATQAVEVLEEEAPQIEGRLKVLFSFPAIQSAVNLAQRYVPEKVLPDSALGLLDEAASTVQQSGGRWVAATDVQAVVTRRTGIPVGEADAHESELLLNLEVKLHEKVVGQELALTAVSNALRRARAGLHDARRPIASFMFVGPTGTGKTETAKAVADLYFGGRGTMVRLDMSEYQDAQSIYKLIGAPAATSESHTEGGTLTQPIREHPFCLILLDELEKAHPDVLNLFLQLLDDGRLTENTGRTVSYANSMIVATSNASTAQILALQSQGLDPQHLQQEVLRTLQTNFRPEFLNRFDAIVPFQALKPQEIVQIVKLMLADVITKAGEQHYSLTFTPEAVEYLGKVGYDPLYGARPLRRVIQEKVESLLATLILQKRLVPGSTLQISAEMLQ